MLKRKCMVCSWSGDPKYFVEKKKRTNKISFKIRQIKLPKGVHESEVCNFCKKHTLRVA